MFNRQTIDERIQQLDKNTIEKSYEKFKEYFGDKERQSNIRQLKEEQYQEGFARELFCDVLGYTISPNKGYNLITELKNTGRSAKKSDAAIILQGKTKAVIELKGTNTQDLDSVAYQAFSYKNHQEDCDYVIISNFEKLRLYVETQIEYEEFNLFSLTKDDFLKMFLLICKDSIENDIPLNIKRQTSKQEKEISEQFYRDYSQFKRSLFEDLCQNNPTSNKMLMFKSTQKLLDRILFVLFCEDRGLLPLNSVQGIINDYNNLRIMGYPKTLYDVFKTFFSRIDKGFKHETDSSKNIFAYNGGLFKDDKYLDSLKVSDNVLLKYASCLAEYDFKSQISTDILGHIFEHSLTEIEEIQNQIDAGNYKKQTEDNRGKRKQDGVFYTYAYITDYITQKTLGTLCKNKKEQLKINEEEFSSDGKRNKKIILNLDNRLKQYRNWLLGLKILDPAVGSGAFLNAALKALKKEHDLINTLWAKIHPGELNFTQIDQVILENNLYGVDINEESVEITKLSLWLHTASRERQLTTLNKKIKVGNSLIDDTSIAGEKAFCWKEQFPEVFEDGGFDVVIANPPFVFTRGNIDNDDKGYYSEKYQSVQYQINLYVLFMELFHNLLRPGGLCGCIVPNTWLMIESCKNLRKFLLENTSIKQLTYMYGKTFKDANVETLILIDSKEKPTENSSFELLKTDTEKEDSKFFHLGNFIQNSFLNNNNYEFKVFQNEASTNIIERMREGSIDLDIAASVKSGLKAYEAGKGNPRQTKDDVSKKIYDYTYQHDNNTHKYLNGEDVLRYGIRWSGTWLKYGKNLAAPRKFELFSSPKIIIREITNRFPKCINAAYSEETYLFNMSNIVVLQKDKSFSLKYILALLNSSLMSYYFKKNTAKSQRVIFPKLILNDLRLFPIKKLSLDLQKEFIDMVDKIQTLEEKRNANKSIFIGRIQETYSPTKITKLMESFWNLSFVNLIDELKKAKVSLSLSQKDELQQYFNKYSKIMKDIESQIRQLDQKINTEVYKLYGITDQQINEIENQ